MDHVVDQLGVVEQLTEGDDGGESLGRLLGRKQGSYGTRLYEVAVQLVLQRGHPATDDFDDFRGEMRG